MNNSKKKIKIDSIDIENIKTIKRDEIKDFFPKIFDEISGNTENSVELNTDDMKSILDESNEKIDNSNINDNPMNLSTKLKEKDYLSGFDPTAADFIRRANTKEQAIEIIEYLLTNNELTREDSDKLLKQLNENGINSFGKHKKDGYYFEFQMKKHLEEKMKLAGNQPTRR